MAMARHEEIRARLRCKCGCGLEAQKVVVDCCLYLEGVMKRQLIYTSGARCTAYNAKVGGARRSQHLYGLAVDIGNALLTNRERALLAYSALDYGAKGWGLYPSFQHFDFRATEAFWVG